jgi:hypothetical protein
MVLIILPDCDECNVILDANPDLKYIVLKKVGDTDIKKALYKLNIQTFPVLLNDTMTINYDLSILGVV